MDFYEILDQVIDLLKQRGRMTYRTLRRQFALDDLHTGVAKAPLCNRFQLALNRHQTCNGRVLSWYILEREGRFIAQRTLERSKAGQPGLRPKVQLVPS
jgi:hypothetical protein